MIVAVCGSLRYEDKLREAAERLTLAGHCALSVIYPTRPRESYTKEEIERFGAMHLQRIDLADAIYVVGADGQIGEAVAREIAYAKEQGKVVWVESEGAFPRS